MNSLHASAYRALVSALGLAIAGFVSAADTRAHACTPGKAGTEVIEGEYIINIVPTHDDKVWTQLSTALLSITSDASDFKIDGPGGMILLRTQDGRSRPADKMLQDAVLKIGVYAVVRSQQPNFRWRVPPAPDLPQSKQSEPDWALDRIRAHAAQTRSPDDAHVVVAVVDSGIDRLHDDFRDIPGLAPKLWVNACEVENGRDDDNNGIKDDLYGASFHTGEPGNDVRDESGHGTLVASIIGGRPGKPKRPGGVAEHVRLMPVRVLDARNDGSSWSIARGIQYAVSKGAHIINVSAQSECDGDEAMQQAVLRARRAGRILVVAAGNSGTGRDIDRQPSYPAAFSDPNLLTVGGTNKHDRKVESSHYGISSVDVGAPGADIHGARPNNRSGESDGTSFAAPFASGGLVLLASLSPDWTWEQRADYLAASVRKGDPSLKEYFARAGVLDLDQATQAPVVIVAPAASDTWRHGGRHRLEWTTRPDPGACRVLDVFYSPVGSQAFAFTLARAVQVATGHLEVQLPTLPEDAMRGAGKGMLRLTCSGTRLHAFSQEFSLE